jgi:hypothetical protein
MDISKFVISSNKDLNDYITNQCNKDINEYIIDLDNILNNIKRYIVYKNCLLFIIYKNKKIYTIFSEGGDTRKIKLIDIVKKNIEILEKNNKSLPNFFIPIYVSDTHFYLNNDIPFFVEAKPRNKKGILYPDQNYYSIKIENNNITYDEFKKILKNEKCEDMNKKEDIIYFSGANTGSDKHNIRMKLKNIVDEKNNKNYDIHIATQYVPMYDFCRYKYLLNLPGHQPWSYRMTKILLMDSLIFDVTIMQTYIMEKDNKTYEDKNDKWIQIYNDFFVAKEDYVEIIYDWTESVTSDLEVIKIYDKINELHKYYDNNKDEYLKITKSSTEKANLFNNDIFDKTYQYLILSFIKKQYEKNNSKELDKFLDELIKLDKTVIVDEETLKKEADKYDLYADYFIKKIFLEKVLNITDRKYNVLSLGEYEKDKLMFIYNNIIKKNKESLFTIVNSDQNKNLSSNKNIDKSHIKFLHSASIDVLLDELVNIKVNINTNKYDIIFIFEESNLKNLLKELIISWNILKYNGFIIVDLYNVLETMNNIGINNYYYFKIFYDIFKNEILYLKRVGKRVIIKKINKKELDEKVPHDVIKTITNYTNNFNKYLNFNVIIPKQKKTKIKWDFILNDRKINSVNLGYDNKVEKILDKINYISDEEHSKFNRFDIRLYLHMGKGKDRYSKEFLKNYANISKNNNNNKIKNKIDFMINLLTLENDFDILIPIQEHIHYMKRQCLKYKKIKMFSISSGFYPGFCKLTSLVKFNRKLKFKIDIDCPIRKNKYEEKKLNNLKKNNIFMQNIKNIEDRIEYKYMLIDNNLFNFDDIIEISKKYNNNVNYINIGIYWKLRQISLKKKGYTIYILLNLLYLVFCMQLKSGSLSISYLPTPENSLLDYIYILSNYYDEVKLSESYTEIKIHCNGFRGISKTELKDFLQNYKPVYDENIKNNLNMLEIIKVGSIEENQNKEFNIKYIDRIISNKINNELINLYKKYNNNKNDFLIFYDKYITKINEYYENSKSNEIRKYVFTKIFQEQYILYLNFTSKLEQTLYDFYERCS